MPGVALPSSCGARLQAPHLRCTPRTRSRRHTAPRAAAGSVVVPPAWPGRAEAPADAKRSWVGPKPISLIGSTGSIGTQTLDIVGEFPDQYKVVALSAGSNVALLAEQARAPCVAAAQLFAAALQRLLARKTTLQRVCTRVACFCRFAFGSHTFPAGVCDLALRLGFSARRQVRKFKPSLVSISDASKVGELKALINDVHPQPESAHLRADCLRLI